MAINFGSPISSDLMYQFYDNKAITPQVRAALQKKTDEVIGGDSSDSKSSESKFGPATRVNITEQIIRMNISNNTTKFREDKEAEDAKKAEEAAASGTKKPSRFDVLDYVKQNVAEREAAANAEKEAALKEIADKVNPPEEEEINNEAEGKSTVVP